MHSWHQMQFLHLHDWALWIMYVNSISSLLCGCPCLSVIISVLNKANRILIQKKASPLPPTAASCASYHKNVLWWAVESQDQWGEQVFAVGGRTGKAFPIPPSSTYRNAILQIGWQLRHVFSFSLMHLWKDFTGSLARWEKVRERERGHICYFNLY